MGLLKSFNNGTQTDLTNKRFGNDRPGQGSSNQIVTGKQKKKQCKVY